MSHRVALEDHNEQDQLVGRSGGSSGRVYNFFFGSKRTKIIWTVVCVLIVLVVFIAVPLAILHKEELFPDNSQQPMNIIFMISDGCGPASYTFARDCAIAENSKILTVPRKVLPIEEHLVGTIRTISSSNIITDSAASATAYACGLKTYNGAIGVDPSEKPCGTLLEAAQLKGMKTGLVVTSTISHATPGSFSSHAALRSEEDFIAKQQVDHMVDVMFGGGLQFYINRPDNINLVNYAQDKGYHVVQSVQDFEGVTQTPVIGLFANGNMDYEIDRDPTKQPSLGEMTRKALSLLKDSPEGFFLLVEGSRIDMAGHANDAPAHYRDIVAYNEAFKAVLEFVAENPNTLVVATSDHETGGLTMGRSWSNETSGIYEWYPTLINRVNASAGVIASKIIGGMPPATAMSTFCGIEITSEENDRLTGAGTNLAKLGLVVADIVASRARVGWTTLGHTSVDVNLYTTGYVSEGLKGNMDNTDLSHYVAQMFNLDLSAATAKYSTFNPIPPTHKRMISCSGDPHDVI